MPKKINGERLVKVVSTKLSEEDYLLLERYARARFFENKISQPSVSHMLRYIFKGWAVRVKDLEKKDNPATTALKRRLDEISNIGDIMKDPNKG